MSTKLWLMTAALAMLALPASAGELIDLTRNQMPDVPVSWIAQGMVQSDIGPACGGGNCGGVACGGGSCGGGSCGGGGCGSCGDCGGCNDCCGDCSPPWANRTGVFGEYLYLNPNDVEVPFAVVINQVDRNVTNPIVVSGLSIVDPTYSAGFRAGGVYALSCEASLVMTYTNFESQDIEATTIANPQIGQILRNLIAHPQTFSAATDWLTGRATYDIDFELADVDYRSVIACGDLWAANMILGARYTQLNQSLSTLFTELGTQTMDTDITFDGGGIRIGIDGEKHACSSGLFMYTRGVASFVSGDFKASYTQNDPGAPNIVTTSWRGGRVVSILDLEMGGGWQSCNGTWRMSAGYMFSGWNNVVKTDDWVKAVKTNDYTELGSLITFDGLTAKLEARW